MKYIPLADRMFENLISFVLAIMKLTPDYK